MGQNENVDKEAAAGASKVPSCSPRVELRKQGKFAAQASALRTGRPFPPHDLKQKTFQGKSIRDIV